MFTDIIVSIVQSYKACEGWFYSLLDADGIMFFIGMWAFCMLYRFLLRPILHGGLSSDEVKKTKKQTKRGK